MGETIQALRFFIFFFLIFLSINLVSAIDTYPQSSEVDIRHAARNGGAIDSNIICNITIEYPPNALNNTPLVDFKAMSNQGDYFNYTLNETQTSLKGIYDYVVTCNNGSDWGTESFQFLVNLNGIEPSQQRTDTATRTIFIFFGLAIFAFVAMLFVRSLPIKSTLFLFMMWFIIMGTNASYLAIQDEVINENIESFFSFFLTLSFYLNYFIFTAMIVIWMVTFIISILDFKKLKKQERYG